MDQFPTNPLMDAARWVETLLTGSLAMSAAAVAVAAIGFAALGGHLSYRRVGSVIVGCFVLFGAPDVARSLVSIGGIQNQPNVAQPPTSRLSAPTNSPPLYDPYAPAAAPSRRDNGDLVPPDGF